MYKGEVKFKWKYAHSHKIQNIQQIKIIKDSTIRANVEHKKQNGAVFKNVKLILREL